MKGKNGLGSELFLKRRKDCQMRGLESIAMKVRRMQVLRQILIYSNFFKKEKRKPFY